MLARAVGAAWTYTSEERKAPIRENDVPIDRICVGKISEQYTYDGASSPQPKNVMKTKMKNTPIDSAGLFVEPWYIASIIVNRVSATLQPIIPIAKKVVLVYNYYPGTPDILHTKQSNSAELVERKRSHEVCNSSHSNIECTQNHGSRTR